MKKFFMKQMSKSVILLTLFCYLTNSAWAQEIPNSKETKHFPAQLSIYYPFATHGTRSVVYNISEKFGFSFTPSIYVMNSNRKSDKEHCKVSPFEAFYTREKGNNRTTMGVGVSLGLSLR